MSAVLYSFRRCPFAMRGRMALHASGTELEHREVVLRDKPAAMIKASPKATVPVLVLETGQVIDESLDVMRWALDKNDPLSWLECDLEQAEALIEDNDGPFKHHLDRYKYASRYHAEAERGDTDISHRKSAEIHIQKLEDRLDRPSKAQPAYLLGDKQSLADIAIFPFIRQFANTDRDWWDQAPYPKVRDWLTRHMESDLFKTIMVKHPVWQEEKIG